MNGGKGNEVWGSSVLRTRVSREPYLLEKKTTADFTYWEWIFIVVSLIFMVVNVGFCIFQIVMGVYIFPIILIINNCFGVYFLINGVMKELPFQVLNQLITKIVLWVLDLVYFLALPDKAETSSFATPTEDEPIQDQVKRIRFYVSSSLLALNLPVAVFVIWRYSKTNVTVFRAVGTEPRYVKLFKQRNLGYSLLSLDAEVAILLVLLIAYKLIRYDSSNDSLPLDAVILLPLGLIFVAAWTYLGVASMRSESRKLTYVFYVASHLQPIYIIYLCIVIAGLERKGSLLYITTLTLGVFYYFLHAALLITVVKIQLNYGKGLKQAAGKQLATVNRMKASLPEEEFLHINPQGPPLLETDL